MRILEYKDVIKSPSKKVMKAYQRAIDNGDNFCVEWDNATIREVQRGNRTYFDVNGKLHSIDMFIMDGNLRLDLIGMLLKELRVKNMSPMQKRLRKKQIEYYKTYKRLAKVK